MSARDRLDALLATDPSDAGCAKTLELLHVYAEIVLAGGDPEQRAPGITAHLRSCPPCGEDYQGLLAALSAESRRPSAAE
ncbi:MAG: hypothetical protein ABI807_15190 [Sporichthyaceae bacterium]